MPSGLAEAAAGAGLSISAAARFSGDFGISVSGSSLTAPSTVAINPNEFTVNILALNVGISLSPLYIAARVDDSDGSSAWVTVSSPATLYIAANCLWDKININTADLYLVYRDAAGEKHEKSLSAAIQNQGKWTDAQAAYNQAKGGSGSFATGYATTQVSSGALTAFGSIEDFGDSIYLAGYTAATNKIKFTAGGTNTVSTMVLPKTATTVSLAGDTTHTILYTLRLDLNNAASGGTYKTSLGVKATLSTSGIGGYGSIEESDTLTLDSEQKSDNLYYAYVTNAKGTQVLVRPVTWIYNAGYRAACDAISLTDSGVSIPAVNSMGVPTTNSTISISVSQENGATNGNQDSTKVRGTAKLTKGSSSKSYNSGNGSTTWYDRGKKAGWDLAADNISRDGNTIKGPKKYDYYNTENKYTASVSDSHSATLNGGHTLNKDSNKRIYLYGSKTYGYLGTKHTGSGWTAYEVDDTHSLGSGNEYWYRESAISCTDTHSASLSGSSSVSWS